MHGSENLAEQNFVPLLTGHENTDSSRVILSDANARNKQPHEKVDREQHLSLEKENKKKVLFALATEAGKLKTSRFAPCLILPQPTGPHSVSDSRPPTVY